VTDVDLRHVGTLEKLTRFSLEGSQITDAGLQHLMGLKILRELKITGTQVTEAGVAALQQANQAYPKLTPNYGRDIE